MTPLVSIVIPTYMRGDRLPVLVERLSRIANASETEVLIVDQSPNAKEFLDPAHSTRFFRIEVIRTPTPNVAAARNLGAGRASGDVLLFIDDDIELSQEFLPHLRQKLLLYPKSVIGATLVDAGRQVVEDGRDYCGQEFLPTGAVGLYRRDFLASGGFDENLYRFFEDAEWMHRLKKRNFGLVRCGDLIAVHHNIKAGGTWSSKGQRDQGAAALTNESYFLTKCDVKSWQIVGTMIRRFYSELRAPYYWRGFSRWQIVWYFMRYAPEAYLYALKKRKMPNLIGTEA